MLKQKFCNIQNSNTDNEKVKDEENGKIKGLILVEKNQDKINKTQTN